ncbi:hypothetical protein ACFYOT_15640 [Saccharothrix saharensis]|uniref:hypothetical protein n=1 Tax=Saccharothrix saharensis TaxID=571190 RepID=UPI0036CFF982
MEGLAPPEVRDAAEFTAALRELRVRTGLSYRQLERRAARSGDVLPASTLSTALSRNTLPREQLLTAYIRACGGDDRTVESWTALRTTLAVASTKDTAPTAALAEPNPAAPPAHPTTPAPPTPITAQPEPQPDPDPHPEPQPRTRRRLAMAAGVLALAAVVALAVALTDGTRAPAQNNATSTRPTSTTAEPTPTPTSTNSPAPPTTTTTTTPPAPTTTTTTIAAPQPPPAQAPRNGIQKIRLAHSGLCVGEGPQRSNENRIVLGQHDCATATPPTELDRLADGTYRIKLHNAEYGVGCATVDYGGAHDGLLLAGDSCGPDRADQKFTLEPANGGYRLRSVPGAAYCVGTLSGRTDPGVQLIQSSCNGRADQLFVFG